MVCPRCGNNVTGDKCPICGTPIPNGIQYINPAPPKKHMPTALIVVLAIVGAIVGLSIFSVFISAVMRTALQAPTNISSNIASSDPIESESLPNINESSGALANSILGINEVGKYKDIAITLTGVEKSDGKRYDAPKSGMEYIIVLVKIENVGENNISYNPYDFKMMNSKKQIESHTFSTVDKDTTLSYGDLAPGGEVEGTIVFEEPIGDAELILQYYDNSFWDDAPSLQFKLQ